MTRSRGRGALAAPRWIALAATLVAALAALLASALMLRALLHVDFPCTSDDAFIALRYAKNLALGKGPVFNQGERVGGSHRP